MVLGNSWKKSRKKCVKQVMTQSPIPLFMLEQSDLPPPHYEFFDEQKQKIESFELIEGKSYNFIAL